jgi:hypothetical protein
MSKGSKSRIGNQAKFNKGFDKIFNKAKDIPELNVEWACYCEKINLIRDEYGLSSKVYTENDKKRFIKAFNNKYK